jgi:hypothetical protein
MARSNFHGHEAGSCGSIKADIQALLLSLNSLAALLDYQYYNSTSYVPVT